MRAAIFVPAPDYPEDWDWAYEVEAAVLLRAGFSVEARDWTDAGDLSGFDLVMPLTRGGPADSSNTLVSFLYNFGVMRMRVGFGSAVGVILFCICVTFAFTYKRWMMRDD